MKKIGRTLGTLSLCAALLAANATPALARGIGVELDGKTYTFYIWDEDGASEEPARYEIDGKTFYVSEDEVTVREPGEPDRHLALTDEASADAFATEDAQAGTAECVSEVTLISVDEGTAESAATEEYLVRDWSASDAVEYAAFAPFGLRCDAEAGKLYYLGKPVRVFEDARPVDGGEAELDYFDESGTVDVRTVRDAEGELTGLEALSDAEFAARDLSEWTNPTPVRIESTATEEGEMTPEESAAFFAPYASFGLRYDAEKDKLYLGERPVRNFLDVRSSNGEPMTGGNFHGSLTQARFDGEVDVTILRDYANLDANGEGKIIGIEATEMPEAPEAPEATKQ